MSTRNIDSLSTLTFHFSSLGDGDGTVPLGTMNECLQQFYLANQAMSKYHRKQVDAGVLNDPDNVATIYELRCQTAVSGCVGFTITIGRSPASDLSKLVVAEARSYRQLVHNVTKLAQVDDIEQLKQHISDANCINSVRKAFGSINAIQRELVLRIYDSRHEVIYDGTRTNSLSAPTATEEPAQSPVTLDERFFTGRINSIGVKARTLLLDLARGGSVEIPGVDFAALGIPIQRESLVQVAGTAEQTSSRSRPRIKNLDWIKVIDQSPITITHFTLGKLEYVADPPLHFSVHFNEQEDYFEVSGDFGIYFTEDTREEAEKGVMEVLECNWDDIAMAPNPTKMTEGAQKMRDDMLKRIVEKRIPFG